MSERKFSILHLVSSERWTGVAEPVIAMAARQYELGHKVWLACIGGYTFEDQARGSGIEILTTLKMDRRLYPPSLYADYRELRRLVEANRIDVIHSHLLHDNWLAGLSLRRCRTPYILARTMHRFEWPRRDPLHQWLFRRRTDRLLTTSGAMRRRISKRLSIGEDRVDVVFGAVDMERFSPEKDGGTIRAERGIPAGAPVAGIVARMREGRGHSGLLDAFPAVLKAVPEAHLILVGRGELKKALRARIAEMPEKDHIHMLGYRTDDLPEAYRAMDVSLFLGQGSEGSCRAGLEAFACGRPVIGADAGGVSEIIDRGRTGWITALEDSERLAETMITALGDREKAARMGGAARRECEERFTENGRTLTVMKAYEAAWRAKYGEE